MATTTTLIVIACGAEKAPTPTTARELYTSPTFRHFLAAAQAEAASDAAYFGHHAEVRILSAEHGLLPLDAVVAPYDVPMGQAGAITAQTLAGQLAELGATTIEAMLPGAYLRTLARAVELHNEVEANPWIELLDVFEAPFGPMGGIGFQRGVASAVARIAA
jgi:hypothetical protein